jgi:hypothetical protein
MTGPAGFEAFPPIGVSPFADVQRAAHRRQTMQALALTNDEILAAFRQMPPERAYRLAQDAMAETVRRSQAEDHNRPVVVAARGSMGAGV